jgi:hypothetical protein
LNKFLPQVLRNYGLISSEGNVLTSCINDIIERKYDSYSYEYLKLLLYQFFLCRSLNTFEFRSRLINLIILKYRDVKV